MIKYKLARQWLLSSLEREENMVEDNEIEAQKSPFALRPGEIKTFDGKDRICFYEPNSS